VNRSTQLTALVLAVSAVALVAGLIKLAVASPREAELEAELPEFISNWMPGGGGPKREGIGVVDVSGVIQFGKESSGPFSSWQPTAEQIAKRIRELREEEKVKAIVLRINSPGGTPAASQAIYEEVRLTAREANKPVVVSMADMAASGGYYIAAPATRIVAHPATITGSIGVIVSGLNLKGLMERYGVSVTAYTSGKNKDTMAYWRDPRPDEVEMMTALVDEAYQQFLTAVAEGRNIPVEELRPLADGRIFLGSQAKALKLVDELGGFQDAVRIAAELAGLDPEDPHLIRGQGDLLERFSLRLGSWLGLPTQPGQASWSGVTQPGTAGLPLTYLYQSPLTQLPRPEMRP